MEVKETSTLNCTTHFISNLRKNGNPESGEKIVKLEILYQNLREYSAGNLGSGECRKFEAKIYWGLATVVSAEAKPD